MKLLIVSDTHGAWQVLQTLVEREEPDVVLHLGDHIGDAQKLSLVCPQVLVEGVEGNCDNLFPRDGLTRTLSYEGVRFFLTHGHAHRVKSGLGHLALAARQEGVDAVLFGHTHEALVRREEDGLWLVNPGTAGGVHGPATYAVATVEAGEVRFTLKEV